MTLHDWERHMTAKGITHNDAVRMLKDAEAQIEQLRELLTGFVTVLALNPSQKERQERNDKIQELWERSCEVLGLSEVK